MSESGGIVQVAVRYGSKPILSFTAPRSRVISLADYNVEKRLVLTVPHRMLLGEPEELPLEPAAAVAGKSGSNSVTRIRRAYYEVKQRRSHRVEFGIGLLGIAFRSYLSWRNWVLYSDEQTLASFKARSRKRMTNVRGDRLATLIGAIRGDAQLVELARICYRTGPLAIHFLERDLGSRGAEKPNRTRTAKHDRRERAIRITTPEGSFTLGTPWRK